MYLRGEGRVSLATLSKGKGCARGRRRPAAGVSMRQSPRWFYGGPPRALGLAVILANRDVGEEADG